MTNMTSTVPVIALDLEGVFCPSVSSYARTMPDSWDAELWIQKKVIGFDMVAAQPVIDFLVKLHEEGRAEIVWLTNWEDMASQNFGPAFGTQEWGFRDRDDTIEFSLEWWKTKRVNQFLNDGRKVIWLDDQILRNISDNSPLYLDDRICMIQPDPAVGLNASNLEEIEEQLQSWGF